MIRTRTLEVYFAVSQGSLRLFGNEKERGRRMNGVYMNAAATTYQKPPRVTEAVTRYLNENMHLNSGRNLQGLEEGGIALDARLALCGFFNVPNPRQVLFTPNVTTSLNIIINGLLRKGDHVLTTSVEHNAVARPLSLLDQKGLIEVTYLPCRCDGSLCPEQIEPLLRPNTKALIMNHASNVLGTVLPIRECFGIARKHGVVTVLDSAQTAGYLPIDMEADCIDVLAFTGHKSLMGLAGIGGFALWSGLEEKISPWLVGGTGSSSTSLEQPDFLPDKFEPGTQNTIGILSLKIALEEFGEIGLETMKTQEQKRMKRLLSGLSQLPVHVYGTADAEKSVPVVSLNAPGHDPGELAQALFERYRIIARSGLHCSPLSHKTAGSFPNGSLRLSPGYHTTDAEIDDVLAALGELLK
jgi:cysteine desulfurase family protein